MYHFSLQIKVIKGEFRDVVGQLLSIDGNEGVVKTDRDEIKLYNLNLLCQMPQ